MSHDAQLLAWAGVKLQGAQQDKMYGTVTVHFDGGRITRIETKKLEIPNTPKRDKSG